jgi:hypothetical protein
MKRSFLILLCSAAIASPLVLSACAPGAAALNDNSSPASTAKAKNAALPGSNGTVQGPTPAPSLLPPAGPADPSFKPCNPYYPLAPGSHLLYSISKASVAVGVVTVTVNAGDEKGKKVFTETAKRLSVKGIGTGLETTTRKYICDGEKIEVVYDVIEVTNPKGQSGRLDGKFPSQSLVMMAPSTLTSGATWSYTMDAEMKLPQKPDPEHDKSQPNHNAPDPKQEKFDSKHETLQLTFEVKGNGDVKVPAGTFHTIRIGVKVNGQDSEEYYAPGIGLVRRTLPDGTVWELSEYNGLTPLDN